METRGDDPCTPASEVCNGRTAFGRMHPSDEIIVVHLLFTKCTCFGTVVLLSASRKTGAGLRELLIAAHRPGDGRSH